MECWRHILKDQSQDPVRSCGLVVRSTAESLLHNSESDLSGDDWMRLVGHGRAKEMGLGEGERANDSLSAILITIFAGVVMSSPVVSSHRIERSVGSVVEAFAPVEDRRMDFSATLGFLTNMRKRTLLYLRRRRCRTCPMRRRFAFWSPLKQA